MSSTSTPSLKTLSPLGSRRPLLSVNEPSGSNIQQSSMSYGSTQPGTLRESVHGSTGHFDAAQEVMRLTPPEQDRRTLGEIDNEMSVLKYTIATRGPDDFNLKPGSSSNASTPQVEYTLREYSEPELFVAVTMYNEHEGLFCKTMNAINENIKYICDHVRPGVWGPQAWRKVVVCVIADGRKRVHKRTLKALTLMGCYQGGLLSEPDTPDVTAHIFEYTSHVMVDSVSVSEAEAAEKKTAWGPKTGLVPVRMIFCLKENNKKKIDSHRWFFNAFAPQVKPKVCILLDVGTKPEKKAFLELWKCFDRNPRVGDACGEIRVDTTLWGILKNPLVASQNFEYKTSNILDKPLESVFGYISVLPGAFSAYRYVAIKGSEPNESSGPVRDVESGPVAKAKEHGPLYTYFEGDKLKGAPNQGLFMRNMYLAEDRILCFELIMSSTPGGWLLRYVKSAKADTDVPKSVAEFISQRRRWLNGSFFVSVYAAFHFFAILKSGHSWRRKLLLSVEFAYNAFLLFFNWFSLANFYLAFFLLVSSAIANPEDDAFNFLGRGAGKDVFDIVVKLYLALLLTTLVCSLGNRPQGAKFVYTSTIVLFGLCNIVTLLCAVYTIYLAVPHSSVEWKDFHHIISSNDAFRDLAMALLLTLAIYCVGPLIYLDPWHMVTSFVQYMFLLPSYVNILTMYSMCNLHDVSWGTKGQGKADADDHDPNGEAKEGAPSARALQKWYNPEQMWNATKSGVARFFKAMFNIKSQEPTVQGNADNNEESDELPQGQSPWEHAKNTLETPRAKQRDAVNPTDKQDDRDKNDRTNVVLFWAGLNVLAVLVFSSEAYLNWANKNVHSQSANFNPYLSFLFFSMVAIEAIRFTMSSVYLFIWYCGRLLEHL